MPTSRPRGLHSQPHVRPAQGGLAYATRAVACGNQPFEGRTENPSVTHSSDGSMPSCCTFVGVVRTGRRESERTAVTAAIHFDVRFPPPDSGVVPFSGSSLSPTGQGGPAGVRTPWLSISRRLDFSVQSTPQGNGRYTDNRAYGISCHAPANRSELPARANDRYRAGRVVFSDHSLTD